MADATAWYDVLTRFKIKFTEFLNTRNTLLQQYPTVKDNPVLLAEFTRLKNRSDTIYKTALAINQQIEKGKTWLATTFGIQLSGLNGLGILPAIPIAAGVVGVAGAVSTITYFISDVIQFNNKAEIYRQAVASGASPQEAATLVEQMASSGGAGSALRSASAVLKNAWPFALLLAGIYFFKGRGK